MNIEILGVDISPEMIEGANYLKSISRDEIKGQINFKLANILDTTFENNYFDIVISERCLLNLPSKESQFQMIKRIWEILKPDGIYVMVEGSYDGLIRLNEIRKLFGLKEIQ